MKKPDEIFCLYGDTQVLTSDGEKRIDRIKRGDIIISYNYETQMIEEVIVDAICSSLHSKIVKVTLEDGRQIKSTTDHPYWVVGKGWSSVDSASSINNYGVDTKELEVGDRCISYINKKIANLRIDSIEIVNCECVMYVVSGGNNNSFFANGIMVHDENIKKYKRHLGHQSLHAHNKALHSVGNSAALHCRR